MKKILQDFTKEDLAIFDDEFRNYLPKKILDAHIHLWQDRAVIGKIDKDRRQIQPFYDDFIGSFTAEDCEHVTEKLFPKKEYKGIFFGLPFKEVDLGAANDYIAGACIKRNSYGLFIPEPDQKEIPDDFFEKRFIGFKPYPDLAYSAKASDLSKLDINIGLFDFISRRVLEFSDQYGLLLLIHLPRKERLNSRDNRKEIKQISEEYPNIKIILAHAGRSYCYGDLKDRIHFLKEIKNIFVDTAMINSAAVIKLLMEELGSERILYGSDLAVAALKGKNVDINHKHYFVTKDPKPWSLSSEYMNLDHFTFFIYEIIRAIQVASISLELSKEEAENIFYKNTQGLIEDILKNIK